MRTYLGQGGEERRQHEGDEEEEPRHLVADDGCGGGGCRVCWVGGSVKWLDRLGRTAGGECVV